MKYIFNLLYITFLFAVISCSNTNQETDVKKEQLISKDSSFAKVIYPKKDSVFKYDVNILISNKLDLIIETTLKYDSLFLKENYFNGGNQTVITQKINFNSISDNHNNIIELPLKEITDTFVVLNGRQVVLPKYIVTDIFYKSIGDKIVIGLSLFGLSNGSNEIYSYYKEDGTFITSINCSKLNCDTLGNYKLLNTLYNISDDTKYNEVTVYPPQFAGKLKKR